MLSAINYHYVRPSFDQPYPAYFGVTPGQFTDQLQYLKSQGTFIHPDDLLANDKEIFESDESFYLVTFDDGLREQAETALPILDALDIPALFFINSINHTENKVSLVHKIHLVRSQVDPAVLMLSLEEFTGKRLDAAELEKAKAFYRFDTPEHAEIKYLLNVLMDFHKAEAFITLIFDRYFSEAEVVKALYMDISQLTDLRLRNMLGNHTHSHLVLGNYDHDKIATEMIQTKDFLDTLGNKETVFISYPYGTPQAVTEAVIKTAEATGHRFGFTTTPGINRNKIQPLALKRFDCNDLPKAS